MFVLVSQLECLDVSDNLRLLDEELAVDKLDFWADPDLSCLHVLAGFATSEHLLLIKVSSSSSSPLVAEK